MRSWRVSLTLRLLLLTLLAMWPPSALALTASQVYLQVKDSVVVVKAYDQTGKLVSMGSGVMLPSGDVVTNYHVVKAGVRYMAERQVDITKLSNAELEKIANGQPMEVGAPWIVHATLKAGDPDKDLCLLAAPGLAAKPVRLGKTARLKVGEPVYAVGAPQGLELSLSEGIVSQLRGGPPPLIQTTVAISPGSSGGGLFNAKGELVGITTFYLKESQSLNFAVPVEWVGEVAGKKIRERPRGDALGAPETRARAQGGWEDRAEALKKADDWQGLLAHCRRWTQAEPGNDFAWSSLGVAYGKLSRHREAVEAYRETLRLKPNDAGAWFCLAVTYQALDRHPEAIAAFRELLRLKPDSAIAWYNLGFAYAQSGNRSAALEAAGELRSLNPTMADELLNFIMKP